MDSGRYWSWRVAVDLAQRHGLDQCQVVAAAVGEVDEIVDLILVGTLQGHGVDLDLEAGSVGGIETLHDSREISPAGDGAEAVGLQGVE